MAPDMMRALRNLKHLYLIPILLAALLVPGYLGGATLLGKTFVFLAIALSGLLACLYWYRQVGLLIARLTPLRYVALALTIPLAYATLQSFTGPAPIPEPGHSWAETGSFGGTLAPATVTMHVMSLASLLLVGILAFLAASDNKAARWIIAIVLATIFIWSGLGALFYYSGYALSDLIETVDKPGYRFMSGPFVNRAHFGSFAGAGAVITSALFAERLHRDRKHFLEAKAQGLPSGFGVSRKAAALALGIIVLTVIVLETAARGALLATGMGMVLVAVIFAMRGRGRERVTRLAIFGVALVAVLPVLWLIAGENLEKRMPYTGVVSDFGENRLSLWRPGLAALQDRPITGWGLGTYQQVSRIYAQENLGTKITRAPNEYLDLAVGWGIPATLSWLGGLAFIGWTCVQGALSRRRDWAIPLATAGVMCHFAVHSIVDFPLFITANALIFALILGVGLAQASSSQTGSRKRRTPRKTSRRTQDSEPETQFLRERVDPQSGFASQPIYGMPQVLPQFRLCPTSS
jgi:O-antigen ligase